MTKPHLYKGKQVVCMTCHNPHRKPNDPGRDWEYTTTPDYTTFFLQSGGWGYNSYLKPVVYRDYSSLWAGPTTLVKRKPYLVPESEYNVDPIMGTIIFHQRQQSTPPYTVYICVSLENDYLRNTNVNRTTSITNNKYVDNQLCKDCHIIQTHRQADCTMCHGTHNTNNLYNIRPQMRVPNGTLKNVVFTSMTGMTGNQGICVVCHTQTVFYNSTATTQPTHSGNCLNCHPHRKGFPSFTTVLKDFLRKIFAWVEGNTAYAAPAPLGSYSMGSPSSPSISAPVGMSFSAVATVDTASTDSMIQPDIVGDIVSYYHNDHLGTPLFMSDEDGNIVWWRQQMPFGETTYMRETITENLRFPGQYWDGEKESCYNSFRDSYYPNWGRYGQPDPIGQDGGIDIYIYGQVNPLKYTDPTGEEVRLCERALKGASTRIGPFHHAYINVNGLLFGFHPEHDTLFDKGSVRIEEPGKDIKCGSPLKCVDDSCVLQKIYESHENPPNYSFGFYDCRAWARTIILLCHKKNCCEGK
jgi:RHS repeat-associated protein